MLSALIPSQHSYPAVQLALQPVHQRLVQPGPLVLRSDPLKLPTPITDRDRTVSRRSEPSSRATLMGEQPNPWDLLQPQDVTSRHRGAKPPRRYELLGEISLLSRRTFYPLSDGPSMQNHRITISNFRPCSIRRSHSQAPLCYCTHARLPTVLRVPLKASDTLSEATTPVKLPTTQCPPTKVGVRNQENKGWYFTIGSPEPSGPGSMPPTYPTHHSPNPNVKL